VPVDLAHHRKRVPQSSRCAGLRHAGEANGSPSVEPEKTADTTQPGWSLL
jgi:hypothetical protein